MNDQPTPSGSRWEPTEPTQPIPSTEAGAAAEPRSRIRRRRTNPPRRDRRTGRNRALLAGVALALVGVGGIGGYAIGATTSGGDEPTGIVDGDLSDGRPFGDGDGGSGQFGGPPDGQAPPPGTDQFGQQDDQTESVEPGSNA